jgi:hypothetical protein
VPAQNVRAVLVLLLVVRVRLVNYVGPVSAVGLRLVGGARAGRSRDAADPVPGEAAHGRGAELPRVHDAAGRGATGRGLGEYPAQAVGEIRRVTERSEAPPLCTFYLPTLHTAAIFYRNVRCTPCPELVATSLADKCIAQIYIDIHCELDTLVSSPLLLERKLDSLTGPGARYS